MAGHSKWANIKHTKARVDAKRGKIFTKHIREITVAASMGGGDPSSNPRLRLAIDKAIGSNMTKNTIQRAIQRGVGSDDSANLSAITYEGYGPNGVAVMVECLTDNKNRSVAEVRHAFTKHGGNLGTDGSVAYLFTKKGLLSFAPGADEDQIMQIALEVAALDVISHPDTSIDLITAPSDYESAVASVKAAGLETESAEITMIAATEVTLDAAQAEKMLALTERLEDLDDVQNVYSNANIPDEILKALETS